MSRRILIIIIVVLLLAIVGGVILYYSILAEPRADDPDQSGGLTSLFPFFGDRTPDTQQDDLADDTTNNTTQTDSGTDTAQLPLLRELWNEPVSAITFAHDENDEAVVRFVERATGHIYQTNPTSTKTVRLSNTTIPKIQEAFWLSDDELILRYLQDEDDIIETFYGRIILPDQNATSSEELTGELGGQFLPINILSLAASDTDLFYLIQDGSGVSGVVSSFNGSNAAAVFSSPIRDWLPTWVGSQTIALTSKASSGIFGHLVYLNTATGSVTPILGNIQGLTTLSGPDNLILYTEHQKTIPSLGVFNISTGEHTDLPMSTLTEKCVWSSLEDGVVYCAAPQSFSGAVPDNWYQGAIHFEDDIWKINADRSDKVRVLNTNDFTNDTLDMIDLTLDETEKHLLFRNKTDEHPWLLSFPEDVATTSPETDNAVEL